MSRLSLSMLGPMQVSLDARAVTAFESNRVRALLAYLVLEPERPHHREELAGLLWPDWPDRTARSNLRYALANLRTAIGDREAVPPFLSISRETLQFNAASDHWLDVHAFLNAIDESARHDHRDLSECAICAQRLGEAVALYKGELLAGFSLDSAPFEEWLVVRREALHRQMLDALYHLGAYHCSRGEHERVIHYAQRQVELEPWSERAHRQWMRALAANGQRGAALRQYAECAGILQEELGVEPSVETVQVYEDIREGRIKSREPARIRSRALQLQDQRPGHNLPPQATPFVGRKAQLAEVQVLLARPEVRLLTLTGVGGTGKTRLALQVAAGVADDFCDGVYWVALAPLRDPALVVPTIAAALGVRESGETLLIEALKYALGDRERLLVIDNFEQVLEAAPAVGELLSAAPGLKVLATSRAPLHVYGEHIYAVPPMEVPHPRMLPSLERLAQADAVSLFLQGAQRVQPGFVLDEGNAAAVAEICARLDGLPLAVELAASRVRLFTPQAMLAHLGEREGASLSDRLQFLTGGPRDAPARQRTLRATIEWSYDLLDTQEQQLFGQLAVFAGGCTLRAVEAVCADSSSVFRRPSSLHLLESLIDQSLLQVSPSAAPRFTMLETVREYAWERLEESGEIETVRDRHAATYASALSDWAADLKGPRQLGALREIEADLDNARAAWEWAVEGTRDRAQVEWMDRALEGLCTFYEWRGRYEEGETACQRAIHGLQDDVVDDPSGASLAPADHTSAGGELRQRVLASVLAWHGRFCQLLGAYALADRSLERALALLDSPGLRDQKAQRAFVLLCMAERAANTDFQEAKRLGECSLGLYRTLGDRWGMARALLQLGHVAWSLGDQDNRKQSYEKSLALYRELDDRRGIAWSLSRLGMSAGNMGQIEEGERLACEAIAIAQELGDAGLVRGAVLLWSTVLHDGGRFSEATTAREQLLAICRDQGILVEEKESFTGAAGAMALTSSSARHQGCYAKARAMAQAALPVLREARHRVGSAYCRLELGRLALAAGEYDEAEDELQQVFVLMEGFSGRMVQQEAYATLAYVARGKGQRAQAREYLRSALRLMLASGHLNAALQSLPAIALLLADGGEVERAIELYALASRYPYVANSRWFEDVAGKQLRTITKTLPPKAVAAAQERGRTRHLDVTVQELLNELGGSRSG